jgi:hypothetical protein
MMDNTKAGVVSITSVTRDKEHVAVVVSDRLKKSEQQNLIFLRKLGEPSRKQAAGKT